MTTDIITITDIEKQADAISRAAGCLRAGELVAFPTETVYGLGADALDGEAVKKIFAAKGRPQDNPLIVHIAEVSALYGIAREIPEAAMRLAEVYWPGPLTIVLPKRVAISAQKVFARFPPRRRAWGWASATGCTGRRRSAFCRKRRG